MCKSNPTTPTAPTAPTAKDEENYVFREITSAEVNDQEHRELVEQHTANDVVVFGAFVAGSLVGIVVAAPVIFVLVLGTGAAALTSSESKVRYVLTYFQVLSFLFVLMLPCGRSRGALPWKLPRRCVGVDEAVLS